MHFFSYTGISDGISKLDSTASLSRKGRRGILSFFFRKPDSKLNLSSVQAPSNMKSVLQAGWLLTVAFGNVIVLIVAEGAGLEQVRHYKAFSLLHFL